MNTKFCDFWSRTGRQYVPAAATDIRETFLRVTGRAEAAGWTGRMSAPDTNTGTKLSMVEINSAGERDVPAVRIGERDVPKERKAK